MKYISRFFVISILIALLPAQVSAAQYQDVIHKKDGSILKGTLIEQDFQQQRYKIQLEGGSVFVVEQTDISKITKEPLPTSESVAISAPLSKRHDSEQKPVQATSALFIGVYSHKRSQPENWGFLNLPGYTREENFRGTQLGFHQFLTPHLAMVYTLEKAELEEIIIRDEDSNEDLYGLPITEDIDYLGKKVSLILSTNQHNNWRFFIGAGLYHNDYKGESRSESLYGSRLDVGMGYSWSRIQLMLRAAGDLSNNEDDIDYSLFDFSLTLGVNF